MITDWDAMTNQQKRRAVTRVAALPPRMRRCDRCDRQVAITTDQVGIRFGVASLDGRLACSDCVVATRMGKAEL